MTTPTHPLSELPEQRARIGDYQVLDVLGAGGMGVVYRAQHVATGSLAAVKTVRTATEMTLESLRREIQMLRELRHPGVVSILDHGVMEGMPWYAMELLSGRTLRDDFASWHPGGAERSNGGSGSGGGGATTRQLGQVRDLAATQPGRGEDVSWLGDTVSVSTGVGLRGSGAGAGSGSDPGPGPGSFAPSGRASRLAAAPRVSLPRIAQLFRKICESLAYVHGQGIIHRDLSPSNVFLVRDQHPVLFDFGLAAQVSTASGRDVIEVGGLLRGTAHYMSPEQARGEIVDARSDLYSLGCILYEALAGRPPFLAESVMTVLMRHVEDPPLPPSMILAASGAPVLPAELEALVLSLLEKKPSARIGYAEDVAARLGEMLESLEARAVEESEAGAEANAGAGAASASAPSSSSASSALSGAATGSDSGRRALAERPRPYIYRPGLAGRTALIDQLDAVLLRHWQGTGCCAVLVGESGVGKTRLAGELATRARGYDVRVLVGECEPIGVDGELRAAPLHPLRPLLRLLAERCREGGPEATARLLGAAGGILAAYEPALAELAPPVVERVDPGAARFRVLAVLGDAIRELTRDAPVLLVIDDLQWADELTLALFSSLGPEQRGLLVLGTARAEEMTPEIESVLRSIDATLVEVPRLSAAGVGAMVRDMLALEDDVPALTELVAQRSEGNPWLVPEVVRAAVEDGALHRELGGRWQLRAQGDARLDGLPVPGAVQTLVDRRMAALSPAARQLAMTAAVLGRVCDAEALSATARLSAEEVRAQLVELIQRQVLHELGNGQLRFAHDRLREHAYTALPLLARRQLHRQAALALEARLGEGAALVPRLSELAMHWEQAAELPRAAHYLERGAEHALATAAFGEARSLLRRLLELPLVVESPRGARWDRWLGEACFALGDLPAAATYAQQSLDQLGHSLPSSAAGWAASIGAGVGKQLWRRAARGLRRERPPEALSEDRTAGSEAGRLADAALAAARMTSFYFFNNDSLGLMGASLQAINLAERAGGQVPVAEIYAQLGYIAGIAKLGAVSRGYFARAHATALATRDASGRTWAHFCEAAASIGAGRWQQARESGRAGLAIAEALRNPQDVEVAHTILGHCDFATGDYQAALASAQRLHDSAQARQNPQHEAWGLYTQGRAALYLGQLDEALDQFRFALRLLESISDKASLILCGGMQACALARSGQLEEARAVADATTARIGGRAPPVFTISEGLVCTAEAYLELWRRGDGGAAEAAQRAIGNVKKLAKIFAIAAPAAAWLGGLAHSLAGRTWRARRQLARALAQATALTMPYDQAMARHGLSMLGGDDAEAHASEAQLLFKRLGCAWHLKSFCGVMSLPVD